MDNLDFKYDVAFSFLAEDEALATQISDLLQDRLSIFLYSKRQGEIAGTDGEKTFNAVFGEEARTVVVLYRTKWGQTPWTRIEETAIRNRAYEEGYDFVRFIPLDEPASVPKWLPRNRLWISFKRWGVTNAASVIESRVEELGGRAKEETVAERGARLQRSLEFQEKRQRFLNSTAGPTAADEEVDALRIRLEEGIATLKASSSISLELKYEERSGQKIIVLGPGPLGLLQGLKIQWKGYYTSSLADASLDVELWDSHPPLTGMNYSTKPEKLDSNEFTFDILPGDQYVWISTDSTTRTFSTAEFAAFLLKYFMDKVDERSSGRK